MFKGDWYVLGFVNIVFVNFGIDKCFFRMMDIGENRFWGCKF